MEGYKFRWSDGVSLITTLIGGIKGEQGNIDFPCIVGGRSGIQGGLFNQSKPPGLLRLEQLSKGRDYPLLEAGIL